MIADTALLSSSPVVLIDEIENAGIDRRRALDLLIAREKITLVSTHDPILALMGDRRIVIGNGAVVDVITPSAAEKANLTALSRIDDELAKLRQRLRRGERIDALPGPADNLLRSAQRHVMDAITLLLTRRSCAALQAPAPEGEALDIILKAAIRVPDFQELRPYEFIVAKGEGLQRLGAMLEHAAIASGQPADIVKRAPRMPLRAPLVIVVVARARDSVVVSSARAANDRGLRGDGHANGRLRARLQRHLAVRLADVRTRPARWVGFDPADQIVGFLYLGTAMSVPSEPDDGDPLRFVRFV